MKRFLPAIALSLFVAQLLIMLVSWLYSAANPTSGVHSLLSSEGLRWYMGHFADVLATPLLVYVLLLSMACGVAVKSGMLLTFAGTQKGAFRERRARVITLLLLLVYIGVLLLLTSLPHAVLLSATGQLWPSPFSSSLVPVIAFGITLMSSSYGIIAGRFNSLVQLYESLLYGIRLGAPCLLFYVLLIQIYESLKFILPPNPYF